MELFIHSLSGAFSLCFQLTCKLHWPHPRKPFSPHLLTFPVVHWILACPIALLCARRYLKVCPGCRCNQERGRDDREHFSHSTAHRIACSDFQLPASSDDFCFWCLSCHSPKRQELETLHIKCLWMCSLAKNPHYIRHQRSCPQGYSMLPTSRLSWQAVLKGHPKPSAHISLASSISLAILSTRQLPQAWSPCCAQPPPACTPEWVNWFH